MNWTRRHSAPRRTRCLPRSTDILTSRAVSSGAAGTISENRRLYYSARSSYFGVIDLAGFKKDRFFLYQAYVRPDFPMAHILPHWTWPERVGQVTPVHVFTSGDEGELFLNGTSVGRKRKGTQLLPPAVGRRRLWNRGGSRSLPTRRV